jgi:hypothetical protein
LFARYTPKHTPVTTATASPSVMAPADTDAGQPTTVVAMREAAVGLTSVMTRGAVTAPPGR